MEPENLGGLRQLLTHRVGTIFKAIRVELGERSSNAHIR